MNLYAILTVATPLTSVVGVSEAMTLRGYPLRRGAHRAPRADVSLLSAVVLPLRYPIARATLALEKRFAVNDGLEPDQPLVATRDVHKTFAVQRSAQGVSMEVMKGEVVASSARRLRQVHALRCVNALVPIEEGSILVEGKR